MFAEHSNRQYSRIAEGDFASALVKVPAYRATGTYYGTKEEAAARGQFVKGSADFFFITGTECPVIGGYLSEKSTSVRAELKTGPMTEGQWEELKAYVDALYAGRI